MSPISASVRKLFARMFAKPRAYRRSSLNWRLELLESRDVPATFYVATNGSDSATGAGAAPWKTLQKAADTVGAGDTVIVRAGTYVGFQITTSGTASNRIVFAAESGVTVNAKQASVSSSAGAINLEGADYVTIDGFTVTLATYGSVRANIRSVANTGAIIQNNVIDNASWWGILTGFSENVLIQNNHITNTQIQHGIYVGNSADNPIVRNNYVFNSRNCGIQLNSDASLGGDGVITGAIIEGNTLLSNAVAGGASLNFDGVSNSIIRNNVMVGNRNGIALYGIDGTHGAQNNWVLGNTIVFPDGAGYFALQITDGSTGTRVYDNVLYRQASGSYGSIGIDSGSRSGFLSDYNVVVDKFNLDPFGDQPVTLAQWRSQTGQDQHSIIVSPTNLFVDRANNDFRLKAGSAAINAGANIAQLPTDLLGVARPSGSVTDIGAYEFVESSSSAATHFQVAAPTSTTAGLSYTVTVSALTSSEAVDSSYRGTIRFTSSDTQAGLPANYTFTAADAGVHSFTVTMKTAGSRTVSATDTTTASINGSDTVTVNAAAASTLLVEAPTSASAGSPFPVTVTARDAFGNTATGYTGTVRLTSTDGQATLPGDYTFAAGDAGRKTFNVTLRTAGTQSITTTDTVTAAINGSDSVTVNAGSGTATSIQSTVPSTSTAGVAFSLTAVVKDAFGNVATGYTGTIRFTSTDGQATLPADYTFTAADAGTKSFSITLKTSGSRSVTVTDTATGSITDTDNVSVNAAAASMLLVAAPASATAGTPFSYTVTARDVFGNKATGFTGTVQFTSTDSQAVLPSNYTFTASDAGSHVFSATLKTTGSQSLIATAITTNISGSGNVSVSAASSTNLARSGTAYRWSGMSSSTSNSGRVAASRLNDGKISSAVNLRGSGVDNPNAWEAAGVIWASSRTVSKLVYINGNYNSTGDGVFAANFTLQFTTDGRTWTNAPSTWVADQSYQYNSSGASGQVITFTGPATSILGFRFVGQVRTSETGTNSWYVFTKEVQAF